MSECCLPNLGCLSIPIISTNADGPPGPAGAAGRSIVDEYYEPSNGELTLTFNQAPLTYTTGDLRGAQGGVGATGPAGLSRLYSMPVDFFSSTIINNWVQQHNVPIPANTLIGDGDALVVNLVSMKLFKNGNINGCLRRIRWNATSCTLVPGLSEVFIATNSTTWQYTTKLEIIKSGPDTALCRITSMQDLVEDNNKLPPYVTYQVNLTGLNFTILNTIYTDLWQSAIDQVYFKSLTIDKISAL